MCLYSIPAWKENIDSISSEPHNLSIHRAMSGWIRELRLRLWQGGGIHLAFRRCRGGGSRDGLKANGVWRNGKTKEPAFLLAVYNSLGGKYLVRCGMLLVWAGLSYPGYSKKVRLSLIFLYMLYFPVCFSSVLHRS